jgi:hypothetical protein
MKTQTRNRKFWMLVILLVVLPILCIAAVLLATYPATAGTGEVLTENLAEPLNGITAAQVEIDPGDGNLTIDWLTGGEPLLAGGTMQYLESIGVPARSLTIFNNQATFLLKAGESAQRWINLPWAACNGATDWHIHLIPGVLFDLTAHSDGGNLRLDLSGLALSRLSADTGGGNVEVDLPDSASNLDVTAKTGAGNVIVRLPDGAAALVHVTTGLGKAMVDPRFQQIDEVTYQTPGYTEAAQKVEITAESGAGNVEVRFYPE